MMNAVINISRKDLEITKMFPTFVVANRAKVFESEHYIYQTVINTAEFLRQFYFDSLARFAKTSKELRSFVVYIPTNFYLTMANREKVSSTAVIGGNATCSSTKMSSTNVRKLVTSKTQQLSPTLYRITMQLFVPITGADGCVRRCGISHTADCNASSEREAVGLALISARTKYRAFDGINARSVILS